MTGFADKRPEQRTGRHLGLLPGHRSCTAQPTACVLFLASSAHWKMNGVKPLMETISVPTANDPQTQSAPASNAASEPNDPLRNSAVQRCIAEWNRAYRGELAKSRSELSAERAASLAYRTSMPSLTSTANIRDFIACAAYGILIDAIHSKNASKLLYAAQVALSAQPRESRGAPTKPGMNA